jgi:hypothetical protein
LPRLNRPDIRHHFCFCASSGLFRRLATGINGALPVKEQYNLSYRMRSPGDRRSLDSSARPLARRGHTLHWLSGAKATLSGVTGALTFLPSPLCCLPLRRVRQRTPLCGDVSACGIVALCRRLRGLAGASAPLSPNPLRRSPPRRHTRRLWQPRQTAPPTPQAVAAPMAGGTPRAIGRAPSSPHGRFVPSTMRRRPAACRAVAACPSAAVVTTARGRWWPRHGHWRA